MKHYGDIRELSGYDIPPVNVIVGGSPCQGLSIAGAGRGLADERSGLFFEQIRIIKEMREHDIGMGIPARFCRPRLMVWENVIGALTSGAEKGADFQAVLSEVIHVVRRDAPAVPVPCGGWPAAGCISGVGDSGQPFSAAWRLHNAEFWGVPQRRRRVALVVDFAGLAAPEVLFERDFMQESDGAGGTRRENDYEPDQTGAEEADP